MRADSVPVPVFVVKGWIIDEYRGEMTAIHAMLPGIKFPCVFAQLFTYRF